MAKHMIINLSALHQSPDLVKGVDAFTALCNTYGNSCLSQYCPSLFSRPYNKSWVYYKYARNLNSVINPYKLGKITHEEFLNKLLDIFDFLKNENMRFKKTDIARLWDDKNLYFPEVEDKKNLRHEQIAKGLLLEAWNAIIEFRASDEDKLLDILKESQRNGDTVHFVSNSNPGNIAHILHYWQKNMEEISFEPDGEKKLNFMLKNSHEKITVDLHLSYHHADFKYHPDNFSTPAMLDKIIKNLEEEKINKKDIMVISQFDKDLHKAEFVGIPKENIKNAKSWFQEVESEEEHLLSRKNK